MPTILSVAVCSLRHCFIVILISNFPKITNFSFTTVQWYCRRIFLIVTRETIIENLSVLIFLLHGQDCRNANPQRQGITIDTPKLQALQHVYQRSGKAKRIDCIVGGYDEIDVVYIAYYDGNFGFSLILKTAKKQSATM